MSSKKYPFCIEAKKHQEDRSRKSCICGGHSANNVKKNRHHNSTKSKFFIKVQRQFKRFLEAIQWDDEVK